MLSENDLYDIVVVIRIYYLFRNQRSCAVFALPYQNELFINIYSLLKQNVEKAKLLVFVCIYIRLER